MELTLLFAFSAGLASVLSPCILPILPIVLTGTVADSKFRPLLIVLGISLMFILMGVVSTLLGSLLGPFIRYLEMISGVFVIFMGISLMVDFNPFKKISLFNRVNFESSGVFSGFFLGMTLGVVWIPCVGPALSSILALVASTNDIQKGIILLFTYSCGFSIPLLIAGYGSHYFRERVTIFKRNPKIVRLASGLIITLLGSYIVFFGLVDFSF